MGASDACDAFAIGLSIFVRSLIGSSAGKIVQSWISGLPSGVARPSSPKGLSKASRRAVRSSRPSASRLQVYLLFGIKFYVLFPL